MANRKKLGEILIEHGATTLDALKRGLSHQRQFRGRLGRFLVESKAISEEQLARALAAQSRMPLAKMKAEIPGSITSLLPPDLCKKHQVIAFGVRTVDQVETVYVAIADPYSAAAMDEIRLRVGQPVKFALAPADEIARAVGRVHLPGPRQTATSWSPAAKAPAPRLASTGARKAAKALEGILGGAPGRADASADLDELLGLPAPPPPPSSASSVLDDLFDSSQRPRTAMARAPVRAVPLSLSSEPDASIFDLSTQAEAVAAYSASAGASAVEMPEDAPLELVSGAESTAAIQQGFSFGQARVDSGPGHPAPGRAPNPPLDLDISDTVLPGIELSAEDMVTPGADPFAPPGEPRGPEGASLIATAKGSPSPRLAPTPSPRSGPPPLPPDATGETGSLASGGAPPATKANAPAAAALGDLPELGIDLVVTDEVAPPEPPVIVARALLNFPPKEAADDASPASPKAVLQGGVVARAAPAVSPQRSPTIVAAPPVSSAQGAGGSGEAPLLGAGGPTLRPPSPPPGPEAPERGGPVGPSLESGASAADESSAIAKPAGMGAAPSSEPISAQSILPELESLRNELDAGAEAKVTPDETDFPGEEVQRPTLGALEETFTIPTGDDLNLDHLLAEDQAPLETVARALDRGGAPPPGDAADAALAEQATNGGAVDGFGPLDRLGASDAEGLLGAQAVDAGVDSLADLADDLLPPVPEGLLASRGAAELDERPAGEIEGGEIAAPDSPSADLRDPPAFDGGELTSDALLGGAWNAFDPPEAGLPVPDLPEELAGRGAVLPPPPDLQPVSWSHDALRAALGSDELAAASQLETPAGAQGEPVEISSDEIIDFDPDSPDLLGATAEQAAPAERVKLFDEATLASFVDGLGPSVPTPPVAVDTSGVASAEPAAARPATVEPSPGADLAPAERPGPTFAPQLPVIPRSTGRSLVPSMSTSTAPAPSAILENLRGLAAGAPHATGMVSYEPARLGQALAKLLAARGAISSTDLIEMLALPADQLSPRLVRTLMARGMLGPDDLVSMLTISQDRLNAAVFLRLLERGAVTPEEVVRSI
jgi:Wiskott-Aldrich syndrome protein